MAIHADGASETLCALCGSAGTIDLVASYALRGASNTTPESVQTDITGTSEYAFASPGSGEYVLLVSLSLVNKGTASNTVRVYKKVSSSEHDLYPTVTLQPGEGLLYEAGAGWRVTGPGGRNDAGAFESVSRSLGLLKVGSGPEATGTNHSLAGSSGFPGAWSPGAPGINGRVTDGETAADAGCLPVVWPGSGYLTLTALDAICNVATTLHLWDVLWVNTGIVVTTTTAQTITMPTLPARDQSGSSNGQGVYAAILVTTATTNAGAITNMTLSYTNQSGTAGRTATLASFAATAVAGYVAIFQLAAGDSGIRSVQSITLGTSLVTGAVSLVLFTWAATLATPAASVGARWEAPGKGVRLYDGACLLPFLLASTTTAPTVQGSVTVTEQA